MTRQQFMERMGFKPPAQWEPGKRVKPPDCQGCPLQSHSTYYVPDEIHQGSKLFILQSTVGPEDERIGLPLCGKTGEQVNEKCLPLAGTGRGPNVSVGSTIRCRTAQKVSPRVRQEAAAYCNQKYLNIPESTELVIACDQDALNYATSDKSVTHNITDWRGFLLQGSILGKTTFVTSINGFSRANSQMSLVSSIDWRRVNQVLNKQYPLNPHPSWRVADKESMGASTVEFFANGKQPGTVVVIDTEFIPGTGALTILGVGAYTRVQNSLGSQDRTYSNNTPGVDRPPSETTSSSRDFTFTVLSVDWKSSTQYVKEAISYELRKLVSTAERVVFHNAMADIPVLEKACGLKYEHYKRVDDTMLAHAALWCELPHTLEFLASIYGEYGKFKHLRDSDELLYNYGDVVDTFSVWQSLFRSLTNDQQTKAIYEQQSLKLIPILLESRKQGIRVNKARVIEVFYEYYELSKQINRYAQLAVGYPINLNSGHQLKHYLYTIRGYPVQIDKDTRQPTTDDDAINRLRAHVGPPFDSNAEITFNRDTEKSYSILNRVENGADPVLEARALWGSIWHTTNNYIIGLCRGVYGEYSSAKKKKAREQYWQTGISADVIVDRIYPNFATHAQKTGRWSTTDPPLAQLPSDLRDIICPDPDDICISWDWSAIEPRVLQALTGSQLLKRTFDENFDLHTWTVCYMFGYEFPPDLVDPHRAASCEAWRAKYNWKGKDDPRRVFAKQGRYEMWYGGSGSNAAQAAASFGLNAKDLKVALVKLASSDPAYYTWKVKTEADVKRTALVRTFMGRPRRFLSSGDQRRREGLDQPMQGAVSDIFNTTVVMLKEQQPQLRWGWGMHDSQKWYVKRAGFTPDRFAALKATVERTHLIAGQETRFPGDFEIIEPPEYGNKKSTPQEYFALAA